MPTADDQSREPAAGTNLEVLADWMDQRALDPRAPEAHEAHEALEVASGVAGDLGVSTIASPNSL